jgi:nitrite reductase (NADH) small subunit
MEDYIDVASVNDVNVGRAKRLAVGARIIALYHTQRGFFASDNTCPHRGGPLADGDLIGDEIICPWHLWGFDVASGVCTGNSDISITTHELKIEGDRILVKLAPAREAAPEIL